MAAAGRLLSGCCAAQAQEGMCCDMVAIVIRLLLQLLLEFSLLGLDVFDTKVFCFLLHWLSFDLHCLVLEKLFPVDHRFVALSRGDLWVFSVYKIEIKLP